ncbi:probable G-protein coupled receptor No18 [Mya arenaria]|uniref:probable G-protein coupled receptor No18 n=1 Tax=Mya arenaria TaxID=6604 RepID=UPI0022E7E974|nr:probable G-protein coupled receptor No18 [Mya arenaria]
MATLQNTSSPRRIQEGPLIDQLNEEQFMILIPSFVLVIVIIMVGLPGNIITICVYRNRMRRTASRVFIIALSICDLVNLLITMPFEISIIVRYWSYDFPYLCCIGHTLTYALNGTSALLLCAIAVDRFRKICRPLKPVFTPKKIKLICGVSTALAFAFYIPGYILYGTQTVEFPGRNGTILIGKTCKISDKYKRSRLAPPILGTWFLATVIIMIVLIVSYVLIGRAIYKRLKLEEQRHGSVSVPVKPKLRRVVADDSSETSCSFDNVVDENKPTPKHRKDQKLVLKTMSLPAQRKINKTLKDKFRLSSPTVFKIKEIKTSESFTKRIRAGRTTMMLFSVTVAYVISFIPFCVIMSLRTAVPNMESILSSAQRSVWNFFLRSYVFNCAINPILYGFFNKDFRTKMTDMIHGWCCR